MRALLSTKEVAQLLEVNEKMVYTLIAEKGLPATKVTGKWLFPRHLVEQWIESRTVNHPLSPGVLPSYPGLLVIAGSNDILLDRALTLFNRTFPNQAAVFGNFGSTDGLRILRRGLCHIAACHLLQEDQEEYNFRFALEELGELPAVVNFCRREQGLVVAAGNPKAIASVADLGQPGLKIVNRAVGTGTRLLLDREFQKAGLAGERIEGYANEVSRHIDVGLEVLSGRADAGPAIRPVARLLGLDFLPLRWERFDLLISKARFFEPSIQLFLGLLHEKAFRDLVDAQEGYDLSLSGKMVFPQEAAPR